MPENAEPTEAKTLAQEIESLTTEIDAIGKKLSELRLKLLKEPPQANE